MKVATNDTVPTKNDFKECIWDFSSFYKNAIKPFTPYSQSETVTRLIYGPDAISAISSSDASKYVTGKKKLPIRIIHEILELPRSDLLFHIHCINLVNSHISVQRLLELPDGLSNIISKKTILRWKKLQAEDKQDEVIADAFLLTISPEKHEIERSDVKDSESVPITSEKRTTHRKEQASRKVFVVHGHDSGAKYELASVLKDWGLMPIILHEQADAGLTIIEKIERYSDVGFAVILYTGCDIGRPLNAPKESERKRARQNVVFEHGYLLAKLGRERICALVKGDIEIPGDISGIVYTTMDSAGGWRMQLAKNLREADVAVDLNIL